MKIIVTGANGFIGSGLLKELEKQKCEIYAVLRSSSSDTKYISQINNIHYIYCDMNAYSSLHEKTTERHFDAFYHLAWEGTLGIDRADYNMQLKNVANTIAAAKAAVELQCKKFICTGTITEFVAKQSVEKDYTSQNMVYAICKNVAHELTNVYCKSNNIQVVWAIMSNTFGKGKSIGNIMSYLINNLLEGNEVAFSSARQPYDCIYLEDAVHALYLLAKCKTNHNTYFIGSGKPRILADYLIPAGEIVAPGADIGIGKRADDNIEYNWDWFDTSCLKDDTGFEANTPFEEGIRMTAEWYKENMKISTKG